MGWRSSGGFGGGLTLSQRAIGGKKKETSERTTQRTDKTKETKETSGPASKRTDQVCDAMRRDATQHSTTRCNQLACLICCLLTSASLSSAALDGDGWARRLNRAKAV